MNIPFPACAVRYICFLLAATDLATEGERDGSAFMIKEVKINNAASHGTFLTTKLIYFPGFCIQKKFQKYRFTQVSCSAREILNSFLSVDNDNFGNDISLLS